MRFHPSRVRRVVAISLAISSSVIATSAHQVVDTIEGQSGISLPTTSISSIRTSVLSTDTTALLKSMGVLGETLMVEQHGDLAMIDDGKAWAVVRTHQSDAVTPSSFSIGICQGKFLPTIKVGSRLEWGAQNSCVTTNPNDVYPHRISSQIRIGRYLGSIIMEPRYTARSASYHEFNRIVTANGIQTCKSSTTYKYDTVVRVTVHGTQFGPKVSSAVDVPCDIE